MRTVFWAVVFSLLCVAGQSAAFAQTPAKKPGASSTQPLVFETQPPFDKLELFGFFAVGPTQSYAREVIQQRGTSFTPDQDFISAFPTPGFQQILRATKTRSAASAAPDRASAYDILRRAYEKSRQKQFAAAGEDFRLALQLAPDSATLHLAYAASCLLSQNFETGRIPSPPIHNALARQL